MAEKVRKADASLSLQDLPWSKKIGATNWARLWNSLAAECKCKWLKSVADELCRDNLHWQLWMLPVALPRDSQSVTQWVHTHGELYGCHARLSLRMLRDANSLRNVGRANVTRFYECRTLLTSRRIFLDSHWSRDPCTKHVPGAAREASAGWWKAYFFTYTHIVPLAKFHGISGNREHWGARVGTWCIASWGVPSALWKVEITCFSVLMSLHLGGVFKYF